MIWAEKTLSVLAVPFVSHLATVKYNTFTALVFDGQSVNIFILISFCIQIQLANTILYTCYTEEDFQFFLSLRYIRTAVKTSSYFM